MTPSIDALLVEPMLATPDDAHGTIEIAVVDGRLPSKPSGDRR
jgi:hypothetical protein